ncbi:hypothetical protein AMECASPLE_030986 [Ameca splendens]|uniref:Uncharacterized protein n=1 Tax=Ameca splendens TaxID=208324 RepID=A0ABV0ZEY1_9TELE
MAVLIPDLTKLSGPPPADDTAFQVILDNGNCTLVLKQLGFGVSPFFLQTMESWFQKKCRTSFHLKKRLWTTEQQFGLFFPGPQQKWTERHSSLMSPCRQIDITLQTGSKSVIRSRNHMH